MRKYIIKNIKNIFICPVAVRHIRRRFDFYGTTVDFFSGFCGKRFDNRPTRSYIIETQRASVTQLVEYHVANVTVAGSNPVTRSIFFAFFPRIESNPCKKQSFAGK